MKQISSGTIITDGKNILIGHSTGNNFWDIPKGHIEENESAIDAAIRECKEETNFNLKKSNMIDLGKFKYTKQKNLNLFLYFVDEMPNIHELKCTSYCSRFTSYVPEIDDFKIIELEEVQDYFCGSLTKLFQREDILGQIRLNSLKE